MTNSYFKINDTTNTGKQKHALLKNFDNGINHLTRTVDLRSQNQILGQKLKKRGKKSKIPGTDPGSITNKSKQKGDMFF